MGNIYQTASTLPMGEKFTKWPKNFPNFHKIYQYFPFYVCKALQNWFKSGFFGLKINNLATLKTIKLKPPKNHFFSLKKNVGKFDTRKSAAQVAAAEAEPVPPEEPSRPSPQQRSEAASYICSPYQGCQMVHTYIFKPKIPIRSCNERYIFVIFKAIWSFSLPFGKIYGHLV
jgi:hypothetical protein